MHRMIIGLIVAFLAILTPVKANAQGQAQAQLYGETEGWSIFRSEDECYMITFYGEDMMLSIHLSRNDTAFFWLQNTGWKSVTDGSKHRIAVEFDDHGAWDIMATGRSDQDGPGIAWEGNIHENGNGDSFFREFMLSSAMKVYRNNKVISNLQITGSREASMKFAQCIKEAQIGDDPFAN